MDISHLRAFARKLNRLAPLLVLAAAAVALFIAWLPRWGDRQLQYIASAVIAIAAIFLLLIWVLFLSGMNRRARLAIAGGFLLFTSGAFALFRVEEVSGDLVPRLVFRWEEKPDLLMPEPIPLDKPASPPGEDAVKSSPPPRDGINTDYPQFLGPRRNAVLGSSAIRWDWKRNPPTEIWRRPVGAGWSAFSISGNRAITQEQRGEKEAVVCYRVQTGEVLWSHSDTARFEEVLGGIGPRATPTVLGDRVYTFGATGILNCLSLADGAKIWSVNVLAENNCPNQSWGKSSSPLLTGGVVVVCAGRNGCPGLVAYRQEDGAESWRSPAAIPGYSSPSLATLAGKSQILILNHDSLRSHDPRNGALLWTHPWPGGRPKVTQPVALQGNRVLISSGYGVGCELIEISVDSRGEFRTHSIWKNRNLKSKFSNIVVHRGSAYGLDDGIMVCIDLQTGKRSWKGGRYGHGQLILAGDTIAIMSERGEMVIVQPDPGSLREVSKLKMIEGKTWNHPALGAPFLLVRNAKEAACYRLQMGGG